jgi:hypothetical protein
MALSRVPILLFRVKWNCKKNGEKMALFRALRHFPPENDIVSLERVALSHYSISHL